VTLVGGGWLRQQVPYFYCELRDILMVPEIEIGTGSSQALKEIRTK